MTEHMIARIAEWESGSPPKHHFAGAGKMIDRSTRHVANRPVSK